MSVRMEVRDAMSTLVLTVGPEHSLREVAGRMHERKVGAAVVIDNDMPAPGIITERDVLNSVGRGENVDAESVGDHLTTSVVYASPSWSLEQAAAEMVQ